MNIELRQSIKGRLAVITIDAGRTYDWGIYNVFQEAILLKDDDHLTIFNRNGQAVEMWVEFKKEFLYILGYEFDRHPVGVDLDAWSLAFVQNKYVTMVREEESYDRI